MRILIVDDERDFVERVVTVLNEGGLHTVGLTQCYDTGRYKGVDSSGRGLVGEDVLNLLLQTDVLFLDHRMSEMNGDEFLDYLRSRGVNLERIRVIGISSGDQPYLSEQEEPARLYSPEAVKALLGITD